MLVETAAANIYDENAAALSGEIDWLDLTWQECRLRAGRKFTRGGREIRILLRLGQSLRNGDILGSIDQATVVVNLLPANVLVATPTNKTQLVQLAFELGNLHVAAEFSNQELITPHEGAIQALLERLSIPFQSQMRRFQPSFWPDAVGLAENLRIIRK